MSENPTFEERHVWPSPSPLKAGDLIGRFRLVHRIGHGGMGEVWMAHRADKLQPRPVAIKLMRPPGEIDNELRKRLEQRFRAEGKILASLDHPNIARFIDAGVAENGAPYVVMEYVSGVSISEYCQTHNVPLREKLELFRQVCEAVHYAHRALVVHRDIKPGNILVTREGVPKLLDFGIAKLLRPELSAVTLPVTQASERLMTPEFASPEQVRGEPVAIASDVYSLGVLLFAILTGRLPYPDDSTLPLERLICEIEPVKPSRIAPAPADVDDIVLKALRKEPDDRYLGVDYLAADVGRYLAGFPVKASRGTVRYRVGKFIQRHRVETALAAVLALVLLASALALVWMSRQWRIERDQARATTEFLFSVLQAPDPSGANAAPRTDRRILDEASVRLEKAFRGQPEVEAALTEKIGDTYHQLAVYDRALTLFERSVELHTQVHGYESEEVARTLVRLSDTLREKMQYARAEDAARRSLEIRRRVLGPKDLQVADSLNITGILCRIRGDDKAAEAAHREAVKIRRAALDGTEYTRRFLALSLGNLGNAVLPQGRLDEAAQLFREALELRRGLYGPKHALVAGSLGQLSSVALERKDVAEALRLSEEADKISRAVYPPHHPLLARNIGYYGNALRAAGRHKEAEAILREALEIQKKGRGADAPETAMAAAALAEALAEAGRLPEAEALLRSALAAQKRVLGMDHPMTRKAEAQLAALQPRAAR